MAQLLTESVSAAAMDRLSGVLSTSGMRSQSKERDSVRDSRAEPGQARRRAAPDRSRRRYRSRGSLLRHGGAPRARGDGGRGHDAGPGHRRGDEPIRRISSTEDKGHAAQPASTPTSSCSMPIRLTPSATRDASRACDRRQRNRSRSAAIANPLDPIQPTTYDSASWRRFARRSVRQVTNDVMG